MNRNEIYNADQLAEKAIAEFADRYFYARTKLSNEVRRWTDIQHQFAGIDLTISVLNIDEKAKYRGCLNQIQQCPSFEVSYINKSGIRQDGWFTNSSLCTDYYSFIGVYSYITDESKLSNVDSISAIDILFVKKSDVIDMVQNYMPMSSLVEDANILIEYNPYSLYNQKHRKRYLHEKFWLTYSPYLNEQPVNLVTTRQNLESLPHSHHYIANKERAIKK